MNRNRTLLALAVAVLVGLAASMFVYRQMQQVVVAEPIAMDNIVVAAMPLPLGTRLQPAHLKTVSWPKRDPIPGMFAKPEDVLDRALITDVVENEPILDAKLAREESGGGLSATIPEGMRAVSVGVNDVVAVAGFVIPGSMVDVLVSGQAEGSDQPLTRAILENMKVLAAGQRIEQDKDGKPIKVPIITLLVTPEQANILTMAAGEGRLQLSLRNTIDTAKASPPVIFRSSVFTAPRPPRPVIAAPRPTPQPTAAPEPPKPSPITVEVIRGNKRDTEAFAAQ
jgi:pilus assembly protein CpaB